MSVFRALCAISLLSPRVRRAARIVVAARDGGWVDWVGVTVLAGTDTRRRLLAGDTSRARATAVTRMFSSRCGLSFCLSCSLSLSLGHRLLL